MRRYSVSIWNWLTALLENTCLRVSSIKDFNTPFIIANNIPPLVASTRTKISTFSWKRRSMLVKISFLAVYRPMEGLFPDEVVVFPVPANPYALLLPRVWPDERSRR